MALNPSVKVGIPKSATFCKRSVKVAVRFFFFYLVNLFFR